MHIGARRRLVLYQIRINISYPGGEGFFRLSRVDVVNNGSSERAGTGRLPGADKAHLIGELAEDLHHVVVEIALQVQTVRLRRK